MKWRHKFQIKEEVKHWIVFSEIVRLLTDIKRDLCSINRTIFIFCRFNGKSNNGNAKLRNETAIAEEVGQLTMKQCKCNFFNAMIEGIKGHRSYPKLKIKMVLHVVVLWTFIYYINWIWRENGPFTDWG